MVAQTDTEAHLHVLCPPAYLIPDSCWTDGTSSLDGAGSFLSSPTSAMPPDVLRTYSQRIRRTIAGDKLSPYSRPSPRSSRSSQTSHVMAARKERRCSLRLQSVARHTRYAIESTRLSNDNSFMKYRGPVVTLEAVRSEGTSSEQPNIHVGSLDPLYVISYSISCASTYKEI